MALSSTIAPPAQADEPSTLTANKVYTNDTWSDRIDNTSLTLDDYELVDISDKSVSAYGGAIRLSDSNYEVIISLATSGAVSITGDLTLGGGTWNRAEDSVLTIGGKLILAGATTLNISGLQASETPYILASYAGLTGDLGLLTLTDGTSNVDIKLLDTGSGCSCRFPVWWRILCGRARRACGRMKARWSGRVPLAIAASTTGMPWRSAPRPR